MVSHKNCDAEKRVQPPGLHSFCFPKPVLRLVDDAGVERQIVRACQQEKEGTVKDE